MEDFGPETEVSVHHQESDWEFLLERAKRYGRSVYEWDGTVYVRNEITVSKEDVVLEFGKSIISFRVKESLSEQISKCTYTGWNMMKCEGDHRIRPGMRVTLKYVGERFSGEYVAERVNHEFDINGFITELHLRRNMLPGEPRRASALDEERERQHNGCGAAKDSAQEDAEEQEEERNPSITNPQWKNTDGQSITKALVGDEVYLCADVPDIPDGTGAKIKVVEKDADGNDDDVATLTAKVSNGRIECAWKVVYMEDDDDADSEQEKAEKGYTLPEYAFTVECGSVMSEESGQLDVRDWISFTFSKKDSIFLKNYSFYFYNDNWKSENISFSELKQTLNGLPFFKDKNLKIGVIKNG